MLHGVTGGVVYLTQPLVSITLITTLSRPRSDRGVDKCPTGDRVTLQARNTTMSRMQAASRLLKALQKGGTTFGVWQVSGHQLLD